MVCKVSVPSSGTYLPSISSRMFSNSSHLFPSPLRGLIFHRKLYTRLVSHRHGFRPLFGDLSSIYGMNWLKCRYSIVSVPSSGTYLPSITREVVSTEVESVSVPSSGTYLPSRNRHKRLHTFDEFPSPLRGLIFHQGNKVFKDFTPEFPSPLRGLIFHHDEVVVKVTLTEFPSPLRGLIFHRYYNCHREKKQCFRPLFGDLSSILLTSYLDNCIYKMFPSPLRGLIFHRYSLRTLYHAII